MTHTRAVPSPTVPQLLSCRGGRDGQRGGARGCKWWDKISIKAIASSAADIPHCLVYCQYVQIGGKL